MHQVNLAVKQGESFGLLGPNCAGKFATMRIIGATSERTSGEVEILGNDLQKSIHKLDAYFVLFPSKIISKDS